MAKNLHDNYEERDKRVKIVGNMFLDSGYSTRRLSKVISDDKELDFKISNATVSTYIQMYKEKYPDKAEQIDCLIEANKGSSIDNPIDVERVYNVYSLVLKDFSIESIAKILNSSYWVIYYDINIRLPKLDMSKYREVKAVLDEHARCHNTYEKNILR